MRGSEQRTFIKPHTKYQITRGMGRSALPRHDGILPHHTPILRYHLVQRNRPPARYHGVFTPVSIAI